MASIRWGGLRPEPYDPDARDADGDGIVQEGTAFERPVGTRILDELGNDIARGFSTMERPAGYKIVDSNGKEVDYTPTYLRGEAPGATAGKPPKPTHLGTPSLQQRGLPTVGAIVRGETPQPAAAAPTPQPVTAPAPPTPPPLPQPTIPTSPGDFTIGATTIRRNVDGTLAAVIPTGSSEREMILDEALDIWRKAPEFSTSVNIRRYLETGQDQGKLTPTERAAADLLRAHLQQNTPIRIAPQGAMGDAHSYRGEGWGSYELGDVRDFSIAATATSADDARFFGEANAGFVADAVGDGVAATTMFRFIDPRGVSFPDGLEHIISGRYEVVEIRDVPKPGPGKSAYREYTVRWVGPHDFDAPDDQGSAIERAPDGYKPPDAPQRDWAALTSAMPDGWRAQVPEGDQPNKWNASVALWGPFDEVLGKSRALRGNLEELYNADGSVNTEYVDRVVAEKRLDDIGVVLPSALRNILNSNKRGSQDGILDPPDPSVATTVEGANGWGPAGSVTVNSPDNGMSLTAALEDGEYVLRLETPEGRSVELGRASTDGEIDALRRQFRRPPAAWVRAVDELRAAPVTSAPTLPYTPGQYPEETLAVAAAARKEKIIREVLGTIDRVTLPREDDDRDVRAEIVQALGAENWDDAKNQLARSIVGREFQEVLKERIDQIRSDDVWVAIDGASLLRFLEESRYKSQFETGTSKGSYAPDLRSQVERDFMGVPEDIDPTLRPTYGFIPHGLSDMYDERAVEQYGPFVIRLQPEVKERTTFTIGDSLGAGTYGMPMAGDLPGSSDEDSLPGWTTGYINTSPFSTNQFSQVVEREAILRALENIGVDPTGLPAAINRGKALQTPYDYQEAQIHGSFTTTDVAEITVDPRVFAGGVPQEVQDAIRNAGITLRLRGEKSLPLAATIKSPNLETKAARKVEPYDPDAQDGDGDGIVQDGTPWERPAGTRIVDKLGNELKRGLEGELPEGARIVDQDGNSVDYTPRAQKPEEPETPEKPETPTISGPQPETQTLRDMGLRPVTEIVNAPPPAPATPEAAPEPAAAEVPTPPKPNEIEQAITATDKKTWLQRARERLDAKRSQRGKALGEYLTKRNGTTSPWKTNNLSVEELKELYENRRTEEGAKRLQEWAEKVWGHDTFDAGVDAQGRHVQFRTEVTHRSGTFTVRIWGRKQKNDGTWGEWKEQPESTRRLAINPSTGEPFIYHGYLSLDPEFRGTGFATIYNQNAFMWYRGAGIAEVSVSPAAEDGPLVWPLTGFQYRDPDAYDRFIGNVDELIRRIDSGEETRFQNPEDLAILKELSAAAAASGNDPAVGPRPLEFILALQNRGESPGEKQRQQAALNALWRDVLGDPQDRTGDGQFQFNARMYDGVYRFEDLPEEPRAEVQQMAATSDEWPLPNPRDLRTWYHGSGAPDGVVEREGLRASQPDVSVYADEGLSEEELEDLAPTGVYVTPNLEEALEYSDKVFAILMTDKEVDGYVPDFGHSYVSRDIPASRIRLVEDEDLERRRMEQEQADLRLYGRRGVPDDWTPPTIEDVRTPESPAESSAPESDVDPAMYALDLLESDEASTAEEVRGVLKALGAQRITFDAESAAPVYVFNSPVDGSLQVVDWDEESTSVEIIEASDWVRSQNPTDYFPDYYQDWNEQFWSQRGMSTIYHATTGENLEAIAEEGLLPDSRTRGLSNRYAPPGVYTSTNGVVLEHYGDTVIEIDLDAMRDDGVLPFAQQEPDIVNYELEMALAYRIGLEDHYYDHEAGMDPDTVVFSDPIPAKYLLVDGEPLADRDVSPSPSSDPLESFAPDGRLYRFETSDRPADAVGEVVYFSPDLEYASQYGNRGEVTEQLPTEYLDIRNAEDRERMKSSIEKILSELDEQADQQGGDAARKYRAARRDVEAALALPDADESTGRQLATLTLAANTLLHPEQPFRPGTGTRLVMDETGIDAMIDIESGGGGGGLGTYSMAFRRKPPTVPYET